MMRNRFQTMLALILLALFVPFYLWQTPSLYRGKLTKEATERFIHALEAQLPLPPSQKQEFLSRLRAWGRADDGKPVYMLNLMRYYPKIRPYPGAPAFDGTPQQSNEFYESKTTPLLLKVGGYPLVAGSAQGKNLVGYKDDQDDWSRVLVVRYPSRRAFLSLIADPAYAPSLPYKLIALQLNLVPVSGAIVIPDMRLIVGASLIIIFLAIGWFRSSRQAACLPEESQMTVSDR